MSAIVRPVVNIEAKRDQIRTEIKQIYDDFERQEVNDNQYDFAQRNILLVGPSKSGKTTLKKVLTDPKYIAEELSLRTALRTEAEYDSNIHLPSASMTLNIVELPETMISSIHSLNKINTECHRLGIQDFHLICFCASFEAGINGQTLKSFEELINYFGQEQVKSNLCLIVTRCESKDEEQRQSLRNELDRDVDYKRLSKNFGRGIHFFGALHRDDWNRANESLLDQFETIYHYRKNLLNVIRTDVAPFHVPTQQLESRSTSKNIPVDSSQPMSIPVKQPAIPSPREPSAQNLVPHSRVTEPLPTVRSDLHPRDQGYEQVVYAGAGTTLLKKPSFWSHFNCFRSRSVRKQ